MPHVPVSDVKTSNEIIQNAFIWYWLSTSKAHLRALIAATGLVILLKLDSNRRFFQPVWPWNFVMDDLEKTTTHLFYTTLSFVHHSKSMGEFKLESETLNSGQNRRLFCPVWLWNLTDDLENNRAPLLCCFKLCASFHSHQWNEAGVTVRKRSIWNKIDDFFVPCDLEIGRMTLQNNRAPLLCCFTPCE